jgi:hypothetical protein
MFYYVMVARLAFVIIFEVNKNFEIMLIIISSLAFCV